MRTNRLLGVVAIAAAVLAGACGSGDDTTAIGTLASSSEDACSQTAPPTTAPPTTAPPSPGGGTTIGSALPQDAVRGPVQMREPVLAEREHSTEDLLAQSKERQCRRARERLERANRPLPEQREEARRAVEQAGGASTSVVVSLREPIPWDTYLSLLPKWRQLGLVPSVTRTTAYIELGDGYPIASHGPPDADLREQLRGVLTTLKKHATEIGNDEQAKLLDEPLARIDDFAVVTGFVMDPAFIEGDDAATRARLRRAFGPVMAEVLPGDQMSPLVFDEGHLKPGAVSKLRETWVKRAQDLEGAR